MISHPNIQHTLDQFEQITLEEMESVKLMDRLDTKFIFHIKHLNEILSKCTPNYKIVNTNQRKYANYKTIYYDTADYALYHDHHAGKLNRFKVRQRVYEDDQLSFLEIKFKNNKGLTKKHRIKYTGNSFDKIAVDFITKETEMNANELKPSIQINYRRITLVNKFVPERITIDLDLKISKDNREELFENLVIMEIKENKTKTSPLIQFMKDLKISEDTFSKYCLGISTLVDNVKKNNFKESNIKINKLIHNGKRNVKHWS